MTAVPRLRRMAMLSVHTSPLDQPGTGDAGGMNVYVVETARRLAAARHRGRGLHPGHGRRPAARPSSWRPAWSVRHVTAGPYEGLAKQDLPGQLCAFAARGHAGRGRAARGAGTTSCTPTTGSPARWAGSPPTAGTCRSCTRCTPWPRSRTPSSPTVTRPSRRCARSARRRSSRPPTGWWPTPTTRPAQLVELYGADPGKVRVVRPGVDLDLFTPGDRALPRGRDRPAGRTPSCCCSSAGSSRSRRRTCWCAPPPSCSRADPSLRAASSSRCSAGRAAPAWRTPPACDDLAARLGIAAQVRFVPAGRAGSSSSRLVPQRRPRGRPVVQRVVRAGRDRGAGVRHPRGGRRRRGAAHRRRRRPGVLVPATRPAAGARALERPAGRRRPPPRPRRAAVSPHAAQFGWDATTDQLMEVYAEALAALTPPPSAPSRRLASLRFRPTSCRQSASRGPGLETPGQRHEVGPGRDRRWLACRDEPSRAGRGRGPCVPGRRRAGVGAGGRHGEFVVTLPGEQKLRTVCSLVVTEQSLSVTAFVVRHPDENHEAVYRYLLRRNLRLPGVAFAIDHLGDVYLVGRVPLAAVDADDLDRSSGSCSTYADGPFNELLELGFAGVDAEGVGVAGHARGESTRNLAGLRPPARAERRAARRREPDGAERATSARRRAARRCGARGSGPGSREHRPQRRRCVLDFPP